MRNLAFGGSGFETEHRVEYLDAVIPRVTLFCRAPPAPPSASIRQRDRGLLSFSGAVACSFETWQFRPSRVSNLPAVTPPVGPRRRSSSSGVSTSSPPPP